ncbi:MULTISPECIES: hypothetical protein [Gilliamella]|uniref:Uncharacterized protein n=1 Tax=Gilliamella apicola TaxID=1196095 RepID=A0A2V4EFF4_9GAMM|nr:MULTISPECIES: hypothetical protein [Gilliamella]OTQ81121.1 hypothetical protein B6D14_02405 [Gilliamella apis]PXZ03458.1 hypothetical protein DKK79_11480 [Gilliamella apicola]
MEHIYCDDYPNVMHWKAVQEFTIEQASLLLAGLDPFDFKEGLDSVKQINHSRWKLAHGYALSLETSIRRGILTPIICAKYVYNEFLDEMNATKIDPNDRTETMSYRHTIITRSSLNQWVTNENVILVLPYRAKKNPPPIIQEISIEDNNIKKLPNNTQHSSEGLELTQEIIEQFWSTYDTENKQTAPTKKEVIDYLIGKGVSKNLAEAVDIVLRPFELRKVGRRKG